MFTNSFDTLFRLITTACRSLEERLRSSGKQRSCFLPRFWMSLSFNSLRSIMNSSLSLSVFGFQGTFFD